MLSAAVLRPNMRGAMTVKALLTLSVALHLTAIRANGHGLKMTRECGLLQMPHAAASRS